MLDTRDLSVLIVKIKNWRDRHISPMVSDGCLLLFDVGFVYRVSSTSMESDKR